MINEREFNQPNYTFGLNAHLNFLPALREGFSRLNRNRFSDPDIFWKEVNSPEALLKVSEAVTKLNLGVVENIEMSGEPAIASENYRVKFNDDRVVLLKRCSAGESEDYLNTLSHCFEFLRENNVDVPLLLKNNKTNKVTAEIEGVRWLAYEYVPAFSHFSGELPQAMRTALQIGKLDSCLKEYGERYPEKIDLYFTPKGYEANGLHDPKHLHRIWHGIIRATNRFELGDKNLEYLSYHTDDIHKALKIYGDMYPELMEYGANAQLIHNDIHPHNILIGEDGATWLIDLQLISFRSIYTEIAWGFYQTVKHTALETAGTDGLIGNDWLKIVGKGFEKGYKLGNPDVEWNPIMIYGNALNESLALLFHHLNNIYIEGKKSWAFDLSRHVDDIGDILRIMPAAL